MSERREGGAEVGEFDCSKTEGSSARAANSDGRTLARQWRHTLTVASGLARVAGGQEMTTPQHHYHSLSQSG